MVIWDPDRDMDNQSISQEQSDFRASILKENNRIIAFNSPNDIKDTPYLIDKETGKYYFRPVCSAWSNARELDFLRVIWTK